MSLIGMELLGDKELINKFHKLSDMAARRVMLPATRKGLQPIKADAKERVSKRSGMLEKAIISKASVNRKNENVIGKVEVSKKKVGTYGKGYPAGRQGKKHQPSKIAHLVEFGTKNAKPHPFMRPALDSKGQVALGIIRKEAGEKMDKVARELEAKGKVAYR